MSASHDHITTLLFDWDGTLADSAGLGLNAYEKAFAELGVPFDRVIYEATYSPNWFLTYEALGLPKEQWEKADHLWLQHYGSGTAELVAGGSEVLNFLGNKGYRLGVVTSGSEERVHREISNAGIGELLQVVVCNEHVIQKKPHPEGLELALRKLVCVSDACCYVGDAPEDIEMGKRANVFTVGVRSAYPSSMRLAAASPDLCLESLSELINHF